MKKTLIIIMFLIFSFNISVNAEEKKCKAYDVGCKMGKFLSNTKEFQKKGLEQSQDQIKGSVDTLEKKKKDLLKKK